jgi:hypothetical protein
LTLADLHYLWKARKWMVAFLKKRYSMVANMGTKTFLFGLTTFTVLLWVGTALSLSGFGDDFSSVRCRNGLIVLGDYERQIANKCGIPRRITMTAPQRSWSIASASPDSCTI